MVAAALFVVLAPVLVGLSPETTAPSTSTPRDPVDRSEAPMVGDVPVTAPPVAPPPALTSPGASGALGSENTPDAPEAPSPNGAQRYVQLFGLYGGAAVGAWAGSLGAALVGVPAYIAASFYNPAGLRDFPQWAMLVSMSIPFMTGVAAVTAASSLLVSWLFDDDDVWRWVFATSAPPIVGVGLVAALATAALGVRVGASLGTYAALSSPSPFVGVAGAFVVLGFNAVLLPACAVVALGTTGALHGALWVARDVSASVLE